MPKWYSGSKPNNLFATAAKAPLFIMQAVIRQRLPPGRRSPQAGHQLVYCPTRLDRPPAHPPAPPQQRGHQLVVAKAGIAGMGGPAWP